MTEEVNDMPVNDDIRAEKSKFKNMTVKEKLRYIWDYYRIPIIIGICPVSLTSRRSGITNGVKNGK